MASGPTKPSLLVFDTEDDVAASLANYVSELSNKFTTSKGSFTVVLSGGYLINSLRKLVDPPFIDSIDWAKWHVFWLDERVVPWTDPDSNYKLAYDGLLSKVPIPPAQIYPIKEGLSPEDAAVEYEARMKQLVRDGVVQASPASGFPRFDLMLLGMGPDGHVASLFPGHPQRHERMKWVTFIEDSPKPPPRRITFTFPVIDASANVGMVVVGGGEVDAVAKVLGGGSGNCTQLLPAQMISLEDVGGGEVDAVAKVLGGGSGNCTQLLPAQMISLEDGVYTWFSDKEAVSKLACV